MGNLFGLSKIKENIFSCLSPGLLDHLRDNFLLSYMFEAFRTPEYTSYQSESVSLLIEEDDVPPGFCN